MTQLLSTYQTVVGGLKKGAFVVVVVLAVLCFLDWLVRTRRINPFGAVGRFMRTTVDPLMSPMERRIVRAGGLPSHAPWWTLVAGTVGAVVAITILNFVGDQLAVMGAMAQMGPGGLLALLVHWIFGLLQVGLIWRVISSWVGMSPYKWWVRWSYVLTEPILGPLRRIVPLMGMIDITPILAYFLLQITESVLFNML